MELTAAEASLVIEPVTGLLREARHQRVTLLAGESGLFDLALPLPDELPHRLSATGQERVSSSTAADGEIRLQYDSLRSPRGEYQVACSLRIRPEAGGFAMQLTVINHTASVIPQVLFPYLQGFHPTGDSKHETLHLGRSIKYPYVGMTTPEGAVSFFDLYRRWYFEYGMQEWNLKWLRLGNKLRGVSVFSKELGATVQGLYVEREKTAKRLTIAWAYYPHIAPGETWVSPEMVFFPHGGEWQEGVKPYKQWVTPRLATVKPTKYLRGSLGVRSVFFSTYLYDNDPNFRYRDLPTIARDALEHGIREVVAWFLFDAYFELPMRLNPKLGTEAELRTALAECRAMGVNVSAFVSVRSLKTRAAPAEWFETDELGNRRTQAWSYSLSFVPPFNPPYCHRDESAFVCPGSAPYREVFVAGCRELHRIGFSSVCFDQLFADRLCYAKGHSHAKPSELHEPLFQMLRAAHAEGRAVDPDATLSGEMFTDVSQTFQHYNWDWAGGVATPAEFEVFRHVFPRYRLSFLVDRSKHWLIEAFVRGLMINLLPDGGEGLIEQDAEFSALVKILARYRQQYARFFEDGEYLGSSPLRGTFPVAALYQRGDEYLLVAGNPTKDPQRLELTVDRPGVWGETAEVLPAWGLRLILLRKGTARSVAI